MKAEKNKRFEKFGGTEVIRQNMKVRKTTHLNNLGVSQKIQKIMTSGKNGTYEHLGGTEESQKNSKIMINQEKL